MNGTSDHLLKQALNLFRPDEALTTEQELDSYYVQRPNAPLARMKTYLELATRPVKVLFSGHGGAGKSTELARLGQALKDRFLIVRVTRPELDVADLQYVDVLLAIAVGLFRSVSASGCPVDIDRDLLGDVYEWFTSEITKETTITHQRGAGVSAKVNMLFAALQGKYTGEVSTRTVIRERVGVRVNELVSRLNAVCAELDRHGWSPLVMVEPLDKLNLDAARGLLFDHSAELSQPACRIVFTFPIALCYTPEFNAIKSRYDQDFKLPNMNTHARSGEPSEAGRAALKELIERRIDLQAFEPDALETVMEMSGGHARNLVRLVADGALTALTQGAARITRAMVEEGLREMANDYMRALESPHYAALRAARESKRIEPSDAVRELLFNQALLEYGNGDIWCDVNPAIRHRL